MGVLAPLMIKTSLAKLTLSCEKLQFFKEVKTYTNCWVVSRVNSEISEKVEDRVPSAN
jgi:hypothetical protein